jgi:hypothetical protein
MFRPNYISPKDSFETFFWPEYLSAEKALPDEKISVPAKNVHGNRGHRQGVIRFDVQRFRKRPKSSTFGRKKK